MNLNPVKYFKNKFNQSVRAEATALYDAGITKIKAQLGYGGYFGMNSMSGGAKYPGGLSNGSVTINHRLARHNSRVACNDSLEAKSIVDRYADTVADTGLKLEPTPIASIIGITPEQAESWAETNEQAFHLWAMDKKQNRSGNMNFYQSHRFYQISQHRDGDIFVRLYYSNERNLQNPLQFEFIDPDQIKGDTFTTTCGFQFSGHDGIQRDTQGREKNYAVWVIKDNKIETVNIPRIGSKSKRIMMLHGFVPEYAGQGRGFTRLAHALQDFQNITDFSLAEIKKALLSAQIGGFVKAGPDAPATNILDGMVTPIVSQSNTNEIQSSADPNIDRVTVGQIPAAALRTPESAIFCNLGPDEEIKTFGNASPSASYDAYVTSLTSILAASMSMPVEVLLMKFNSNYSASRAALILFWRIAEIWRQEMAADYLNPIYEMWLSGEIAAGRITAPGWSDPRIRNAWLNNSWIGAPMPNIDPMKTAKATRTNIETGITTISREARNHNGSNAKSNLTKNAKEFPLVPESPYNKGTTQ